MIFGIGMFIFVVSIVACLVWKYPHSLTFDKEAHLIDRGKLKNLGTETKQITDMMEPTQNILG